MTELQKVNLGTPPTAVDGDTSRDANAKANSNVDVLNTQAALTSSPAVITVAQALTATHIGKRVNINLAAAGVINLPAASTCAADQVTLLRNLGATVVTLAITPNSGDTLALSALEPGETALLDTDGAHAWTVLIRGRSNSDDEVVKGNSTVSGNLIVSGFAQMPDATKANQAATLGQLNAATGNAGGTGFRNKLLNARFNVNQRGYVSGAAVTAANAYTVDRWRVIVSGQALTLAASENGNIATAPAGGIEEIVSGTSIEGGPYVISWTGTATCKVAGVVVAKGGTFNVAAGANLSVQFFNGTVSKPQIEQGTTPTPFESRPYEVELLICQWYFRNILISPSGGIGVIVVVSQTSALMWMLIEAMRVPPTAAITAGAIVGVTSLGAIGIAGFTNAGPTVLQFNFAAPAGLTAFTAGYGGATGAGATISLDAEFH